MDTQKECMIPECGNLPDLTGKKLVVGVKQLRKAVQSGQVQLVFLAENADPGLTMPLESLCREAQIQLVWARSMRELGRACGIDVGAAAAGVIA